jgi:hypothetical protein
MPADFAPASRNHRRTRRRLYLPRRPALATADYRGTRPLLDSMALVCHLHPHFEPVVVSGVPQHDTFADASQQVV